MGSLVLAPLSLPLPRRRRAPAFPPSPTPSSSLLSLFKPSSIFLSSSPSRGSRRFFSPLRSSNKGKLDESRFLDEDGVVEDMDGYLNYLSLEYDSVWDTKPSWCQPWTIVLFGVVMIACSWQVIHSAVISAVVLSLVCAWWYIFLYSYPKKSIYIPRWEALWLFVWVNC